MSRSETLLAEARMMSVSALELGYRKQFIPDTEKRFFNQDAHEKCAADTGKYT